MNELSISLLIADRSYKLVIEKEHEELFRNAAKLIDKRIKDYSSNYAYKDKQDLLAMVALEYTTRFLQEEETVEGRDSFLEQKLAAIDSLLNEYVIL